MLCFDASHLDTIIDVNAVTIAQSAEMGGTIGSVINVVKVGRRSRFRKMTRAQVEKLWNHAKKTWIMVNETLKNGKWNHKKEEESNEERIHKKSTKEDTRSL